MPNAAVAMVVEVEEVGTLAAVVPEADSPAVVAGPEADSPAVAPSVVAEASEAEDITEAAVSMEAAVSTEATSDLAAGGTPIIPIIIPVTRITDTIRTTTATILTRTAAVRIPRRQ